MHTLQAAGLLLFLSCVAAEIVSFEPCPSNTDDDGETVAVPTNCTLHEVRVSPCPEAAEDEPCKIKRGKAASIEVEFTSDVASTELTQKAYWANNVADLPFTGMDPDACVNTACPITAGQRQAYTYQLHVSKKFPVRMYDVKIKLFNEPLLECCFIIRIKLVK